MRILNYEQLVSHGNKKGREIVASIMEAGLQAADPYHNACKLLRREGDLITIGAALFEAEHDPNAGVEVIDLKNIKHIYVVGAGKGVQRVAKALEEVLGDNLTGGEVVAKHGDDLILNRIHVTFGAHPIPDEGCVEGCKKIIALSQTVTKRDLVFTIIANGGSSLLTLPQEGIGLDDVKYLTKVMQVERGVPTVELNIIRNHIDQLKGGKISRLFSKAQEIHLVVTDANHHVIQDPRHDYFGLLQKNIWLHNLPEGSTFSQAIEVLKKYSAWDVCPKSIRDYLEKATEEDETVKYQEFVKTRFRVFGLMPDSGHFLPAARKKAEELGFHTAVLTQLLQVEAGQYAKVISSIAKNIEQFGEPLQAPVVLFSSSEMLVTVDKHMGVGGRNQEFALAGALEIKGNEHIVIGSADSDGTDGPGGLNLEGAPYCLGGGIVDGTTVQEAALKNIDLQKAIRTHDTSEALWKLNCGMHIEQNISLNDLTVILIQ